MKKDIQKSLTAQSETAAFPDHWRRKAIDQVDELAEAMFLIDLRIQRVNQMLHRAQGARMGKISVRFIKAAGKGDRDRVPTVVKWWGKDGPTIYKVLPKSTRYNTVRAKAPINDKAIRVLLKQLNELMEQRQKIEEVITTVGKVARNLAAGTKSLAARVEEATLKAEQLLERDFTQE